MSTYVPITRKELEEVIYPLGFKVVQAEIPAFSKFKPHELVYDCVLKRDNQHFLVRIYSSINKHTGVSRAKGKDRIRIVTLKFWPSGTCQGFRKTIQINRVGEWKKRVHNAALARIADVTHRTTQEVLDSLEPAN